MIVFVDSIGSLWQEKVRTSGYTTVWNTTGVDDGKRLRSRAKVFGQLAFGRKARLEVGRFGGIPPSMWLATEVTEHKGIRRVQLIVRVAPSLKPERYLVTVTERLVGTLQGDSWASDGTELISFSAWKEKQEAMLLMQPFGWIRGTAGSAVFSVDGRTWSWTVQRW